MQTSPPALRPRLVILQPTALCNLNCGYCYLPDRRDRSLMPDVILEKTASFVFACDLHPEIEFLWHAGEPLAAGLSFYRRAFSLLAERAPKGLRIRHTIQTNGTLLNPKWCELFREYQVDIGLSVDGPAEIHDRVRVTWAGAGTHAKVMAGYRLIRHSGMRAGAICVLTRESLQCPDQIYDFFKDAGFASVAFNVEESEGVHVRSGLQDVGAGEIRQLYAAFMHRIWQRWRADESPLIIREFKEMLGCLAVYNQDKNFVRNPPEVAPFNILTIRRDGGVSTFSPELASTPNRQYGNFILGNVLTDTPAQVAGGEPFARLHRDVAAGQARCRERCAYYALCGAAFQSNRLSEHGNFLATETLTCRLHRQTLADVLIDELVAESRRRGAAGPAGPAPHAAGPQEEVCA